MKRVTLGRHGELATDEARKQAAVIIDCIKRGEAPMPAPEPTVADLAECFMRVHVKVHCKPSTAATYRGHLDCHILPALGEMALGAVGRAEVAALHHRLRDTPPTANAVVRTISTMFHLAEAWELVPSGRNPCRSVRQVAVERTQVRELHHRLTHAPSITNMVVCTLSLMYRLTEDWGLVSEGCNPCRSVVKYPQRERERFLTDEEFTRLGQVLDEVETEGGASPAAVVAIRLLMLTGCRKSEILTLRWEHVAFDAGE